MNEERIKLEKMDKQADVYSRRYREELKLLEKSPLGRKKGGITSYEMFTLGKMLESFDTYRAICEEEGTVNMLGKIPSIAHDVITVSYGTAIMPYISSVQPVDEEDGNVYFKNVKAVTTKGNITAGDSLTSVTAGKVKTGTGYASNYVSGEVVDTGDGTKTDFTFTLPDTSVRRGTVVIKTTDDIYAKDDAAGNLLGIGVSGSIDYTTGQVTVNFQTAPANGQDITASYQINYEGSSLPEITTFWDSKKVISKIFALKGSIGMFQSYGMRKRFGLVGEDELAADLVGEINAEIGGDLIRAMNAAAVGITSYSKTAPNGVSDYEHRMALKFKLAEAESVLGGNAGRGVITTWVAGRNVCSYISTLPGFVKISDGNTIGSHVYGELDGQTIIKVNDTNTLDADTALGLYKGNSPFEAPSVWSPFMPLVVTSTLPEGVNPLASQRAAAVWGGTDVLVSNFITKLVLT